MILFSGAKVQKNFEQCKYFKKKDFEKLFFCKKKYFKRSKNRLQYISSAQLSAREDFFSKKHHKREAICQITSRF